MPCQEIEAEMNAPDNNPPYTGTPVKVTGNDGAGRVDPDGESFTDNALEG
jgi:hypothetical protein